MKSDTVDLDTQRKSSPWGTIVALILLIVVGVWLFGKAQNVLRPKSWMLFVYTTNRPDQIKTRINYSSKTECLEKGWEKTGAGLYFECGYNCKGNLIESCEQFCNAKGACL